MTSASSSSSADLLIGEVHSAAVAELESMNEAQAKKYALAEETKSVLGKRKDAPAASDSKPAFQKRKAVSVGSVANSIVDVAIGKRVDNTPGKRTSEFEVAVPGAGKGVAVDLGEIVFPNGLSKAGKYIIAEGRATEDIKGMAKILDAKLQAFVRSQAPLLMPRGAMVEPWVTAHCKKVTQ